MAMTKSAKLKVTQIGSSIGRPKDQRATLIGLGLNKMHRSRLLDDSPAIRGMIDKGQHLVHVEDVNLGGVSELPKDLGHEVE